MISQDSLSASTTFKAMPMRRLREYGQSCHGERLDCLTITLSPTYEESHYAISSQGLQRVSFELSTSIEILEGPTVDGLVQKVSFAIVLEIVFYD